MAICTFLVDGTVTVKTCTTWFVAEEISATSLEVRLQTAVQTVQASVKRYRVQFT